MSHHSVTRFGQSFAAALLLGHLVAGCAYGEMRQVLRAQVASEADCPELTVSKVPAYAEGFQENQYRVVGCGVDRVYTCQQDGGLVKFGNADCTYVAAATRGPEHAPAATPDDDTSGDEDDATAEPDGDSNG